MQTQTILVKWYLISGTNAFLEYVRFLNLSEL